MPTKKKFEKYAKLLNPIDDLMFCKMAEHKEFCDEFPVTSEERSRAMNEILEKLISDEKERT